MDSICGLKIKILKNFFFFWGKYNIRFLHLVYFFSPMYINIGISYLRLYCCLPEVGTPLKKYIYMLRDNSVNSITFDKYKSSPRDGQ